MGYRDAWLNHAGLGSRHYEVAVHAFDRNEPTQPARVLVAGVENGGALQVWSAILPEGSEVIGVDNDPRCAQPGIDVRIGDVLDDGFLRGEFRYEWFDIIVDSTETLTPYLWPFLYAHGRYFIEGYEMEKMMSLVEAVAQDGEGWLPVEEIMRIEIFPHIAVIEKRNPRVVPYMECVAGNFCDVVTEEELLAQGVRRVVV